MNKKKKNQKQYNSIESIRHAKTTRILETIIAVVCICFGIICIPFSHWQAREVERKLANDVVEYEGTIKTFDRVVSTSFRGGGSVFYKMTLNEYDRFFNIESTITRTHGLRHFSLPIGTAVRIKCYPSSKADIICGLETDAPIITASSFYDAYTFSSQVGTIMGIVFVITGIFLIFHASAKLKRKTARYERLSKYV